MKQHTISLQDMQCAIDNREFQVYFQPKVDIGLNRIDGFEALLRWKKDSETNSFVCSPDIFVPLAETYDCITQLTLYVTEEVCKQIQKWKRNGLQTVPVAINISKKDLTSDAFVQQFLETLCHQDIDFKYIQLEITETAFVHDSFQIVKNIKRLRSHGIKIAIDDFGTGYASLACLKTLPADILKVDRLFLHNINRDSINQNILASILSLARSIGLDIVYEGIETKEEAEYIQDFGFHVAQGFYYSAPLPPEQVLPFLRQGIVH